MSFLNHNENTTKLGFEAKQPVKCFQPTMHLRMVKMLSDISPLPGRLQQKWTDVLTGEYDWRDIEVVYLNLPNKTN